MAIEKFYVNSTSYQDIAAAMYGTLVPDYFSSVTFDGQTQEINCLDDDGNLAMKITAEGAVICYTSQRDYVNAFSIAGADLAYAYVCSFGVMLQFGLNYGNPGCILFSKTNQGKTAIVCCNNLYTTIYRVAYGDVAQTNTLTFTPVTGNQTQLVPFCTDSQMNAVSYTPNAFYIPYGQYYTMGYGAIKIDNQTYLTNGYWAIKDA